MYFLFIYVKLYILRHLSSLWKLSLSIGRTDASSLLLTNSSKSPTAEIQREYQRTTKANPARIQRPRNIKSFERAKGPEAVGRSGEIRVYLREGDLKVKPFVRLAHHEKKERERWREKNVFLHARERLF